MSRQVLPFTCEHAAEVVTIALRGELDHASIAVMTDRVAPAKRVILDLTEVQGAYSTVIAACIQLATCTGQPVQVRGGSKRFETTLVQMNLRRMVTIAGESAAPATGPSAADLGGGTKKT